MIGFFRFLIFILITAFCVFYAVENQDALTFIWSPFHDGLTVPSYIPGLGGLGAGFLIGACLGWLNLLPKKLEIYKLKKQIVKLEKQLEEYVQDDTDISKEHLPAAIDHNEEQYD